tara:strand:- start:1792 stop:2361 length:570 start_codon:yes stop_codon:yes gene_type:complete
MSKNNRKLKCISKFYKLGSFHPIYFNFYTKSDKEECFVNNLGKDNKKPALALDLTIPATEREIEDNINIPHINFDYELILSFYNITDIDSLNEFINENINSEYIEEINFILDIWIRQNIDDLKKYNEALFPIIKEILLKFTDITEIQINKELLDFISYWMNSKNSDDFNFNLIHDFKKYLNKKYGRKKT